MSAQSGLSVDLKRVRRPMADIGLAARSVKSERVYLHAYDTGLELRAGLGLDQLLQQRQALVSPERKDC